MNVQITLQARDHKTTGLAKINISQQRNFLNQMFTNLQKIILLDNYVMTKGKILKRSFPEIVLYTKYEYI